VAVEEILDGEADALARKAIELALAGDTVALRLCLERIAPDRRDRTIRCELPEIASAADAVRASAALIAAVTAGDLTPSEAETLGRLLDAHVKALEASDFEQRLARLEQESAR
jgi:hypothetical protein